MESTADLESQLVESLNAVSTIKQFGIETFSNIKTEIRFAGLLENTYKGAYGSIIVSNSMEWVSSGITIVLL